MKKTFAILTIFFICAIGKTATDSNNIIVPDSNNTTVPGTNTTADCQEKIKQLERVIESQEKRLAKITDAFNNLKKQLDEQIKENERLKALLPQKDKINLNSQIKTSFDPNNGIVYHGKKRSTRWFNDMYEKFCDKFIYSQGKYIDIGKNVASSYFTDPHLHYVPNYVPNELTPGKMVWPIGSLVQFRSRSPMSSDGSTQQYRSTVLSVLGEGDVLVQSYYVGDMIVRIHGLKGDFVDGQDFPDNIGERLIYEGIYKYTSAMGAHKTVPSLIPYEPLTKEQFAEAINSGFELVVRTESGGKITETPIK
jgi:hypothetical protein